MVVVKKQSHRANLDFNNLIHIKEAGVYTKHLKPGVLIEIPAIEFNIIDISYNNPNETGQIVILFLGLEIATLESIDTKKWNSQIDFQDKLSTTSHLFMKFMIVSTSKKESIYLGQLKKGLPEDINNSIYFLPGASLIE
jgi:hypothetical protein